jgi:alanyl-tRNA synthetase
LEPRLHPVQRERRRHLFAAARAARGYRDGIRASHIHHQGTKNFTDFANAKISNYETDIFRPIFDEIEKLSGKHYGSTLPQPNESGQIVASSEQEKVDVAFRVIADHIRNTKFRDRGWDPAGHNDRNYVLRRILRRAVRYGRR